MKQKFLIVHPSRGRPEQAKKAIEWFRNSSSGRYDMLWHTSLDLDDPFLGAYQELVAPVVDKVVVSQNRGLVEAVNRLYDEELLKQVQVVLMVSDDMLCPKDWDTHIVSILEKEGYDKILKTVNQFAGDLGLIVFPIAGAQFFLDYGCFYYHEYLSLFADNDMTEWAKANNRYIKDSTLFPHMHPHVAEALPDFVKRKFGECLSIDPTYLRENSSEGWVIGQKVFNERMLSFSKR